MTKEIFVLDHGYVRLISHMGSDEEIEQDARLSYGEGTRSVSDTRNLIRYLFRNEHTSPFEMAEMKFEMQLPLFVARQLVRHRTANINEYSGRYSIMPELYYVPDLKNIQAQSSKNKQGREDTLSTTKQANAQVRILEHSRAAFREYEKLINQDKISRELARMVLPQNIYTKWRWKMDLKNLLHMIHLRTSPHAQWEIRQYAKAVAQFIEDLFPITHEAYQDYKKHSKSFSWQETTYLSELVEGKSIPKLALDYMSKREFREFHKKLNLECPDV